MSHVYRRILMAYDGSQSGREALEQGAAIAQQNAATIDLLAVVHLPSAFGFIEAGYPDELVEEELQRVDGILDEGVSRLKERGLAVAGHRRSGEPVIEISRLATELKADLVVVGHRRRGRLARWWNTSLGVSLLDELDCSLLVAMPGRDGLSDDG